MNFCNSFTSKLMCSKWMARKQNQRTFRLYYSVQYLVPCYSLVTAAHTRI